MNSEFKKKNKYYVKDCIPWEGEWRVRFLFGKPFGPCAEEFLPECDSGRENLITGDSWSWLRET